MARVPTTIPFCIDWLPDGRLLVVAGREGLLLRLEPDGSLATHADLTGLSRQPWNEIVVDGRGNAYVNNTGFDFPGGDFAPGAIALVAADGSARQVADGIAFPNGMVVTPDNATLIATESFASRLTAFDITVDGSLSNRRIWADLGQGGDGICLDADGAVWSPAWNDGKPCCVRVREGGQVLQRIELDEACFACMLGGEDRTTLYMLVAEFRGIEHLGELFRSRTGQVLTAPAPAPGAGWP
jgi:sugar lactone lactonase YvrE